MSSSMVDSRGLPFNGRDPTSVVYHMVNLCEDSHLGARFRTVSTLDGGKLHGRGHGEFEVNIEDERSK